MKFFAHMISYIFHPIFIPLYLITILLFLPVPEFRNYPIYFKYYIIVFVFLLDVVMPLTSISLMKKYGVISSFHIEKAEERTKPYLLLFFLYSITAISFMSIPGIHPIIPFAFILSALMIIVVNFINRFIKISAHSVSMAAVASWFYILDQLFEINFSEVIIITVILLGVVMSSRLFLQVHTPREVYWGSLVGIVIPILGGSIFLF